MKAYQIHDLDGREHARLLGRDLDHAAKSAAQMFYGGREAFREAHLSGDKLGEVFGTFDGTKVVRFHVREVILEKAPCTPRS